MPRLPRATTRPTRSTLAGAGDQAILYGRVSTDDQEQAGTIDAQKDFLRGYARLYQLNVVAEHWDDGVSGTIPLADRPAGGRLLETAAGHPGAVVLGYKLDRLGRSLRVMLDAHDQLADLEVSIRSATEPFDTSTPFGTFMFQFIASMAELDRSNLLEKLSRGRDRVARVGKWTGGVIPYGYDLDGDGRLAPSRRRVGAWTEAEIAREVIANVANGSSCVREAERLNALGVPAFKRWAPGKKTPTGTERVATGKWYADRVIYMIHNEVYAGPQIVHSKYGDVERPVAEPLVDRATLDRARDQLTRNMLMSAKNHRRFYLLRGLMKCQCGCTYIGVANGGGGTPGDLRRYRCSSQASVSRRKTCNGKSVGATALEALVWADCKAWAHDPGKALADAQAQLRQRLDGAPAKDEQRKRLQQNLVSKQEERARVLTLARQGTIRMHEAERELEQVERERAGIQALIDGLQAELDLASAFEARYAEASASLARVRARIAGIEARLASGDPAKVQAAQTDQRGVIEDLVSGITIRTETDAAGKRSATAEITYVFGDPNLVATGTK